MVNVWTCTRFRLLQFVLIPQQETIRLVVASAEFQDAGEKLGFMPAFLSTRDFGKLISADDAKLAALMATLGLKKR